jgi:YggT family protein
VFDSGHFFGGLIGLVSGFLNIFTIVILVRVVASWVGADPYNPIIQFLSRLTDPLFSAIRQRLPRVLWDTGMDFSPFIALLGIQVVILMLGAIRI